MKEKKYTGSPLPFRGSKRYHVKRFKEVLQQVGEVDTVIDLFGGSGLLARVAKDTLPHCRVIYNDFDYYVDRLAKIDVLTLISQTKYVLFTSGKSQILELCQWLNQSYNVGLLEGSIKYEQNRRINNFAACKDIMIVKI